MVQKIFFKILIFVSFWYSLNKLSIFSKDFKSLVNDILLKPNGVEVTNYTNLVIGVFLVIITSIVVLGGLKRIGKVTSRLVPSMVLLYFILVVVILIVHIEVVPKIQMSFKRRTYI